MKRIKYVIILSLVFNAFLLHNLLSNPQIPKGKIKGIIVDADTKVPLAGANVMIINSQIGAATDKNGSFIIENEEKSKNEKAFKAFPNKPAIILE